MRAPRRIAGLTATALAVAAVCTSTAAADAGSDGVPINPYGYSGPKLVPGGVGAFQRRGRTVTFDSFDAATGKRSTLARMTLDRRIAIAFEDLDANAAVSPTHLAVAFASEWTDDSDSIHPLGGSVRAGPLGGAMVRRHACGAETNPAPIDLDGSLLVAAQRTVCGPRAVGEDARFDVVVHDLAAGGTTTLARDVIVGEDEVAVARPYVAFAAAGSTRGEGYGGSPNDVRVHDVRTGAQVTHVALGKDADVRSIDVTSGGRVVLCAKPLVGRAVPRFTVSYADSGEASAHPTQIPCSRIQALPDGRVATQHGRQVDVADLATNERRVLLRAGISFLGFDTDGTRIAWQDVTCRAVLARVAPISALGSVASTPRLKCPATIGRYVEVERTRRRAHMTLTCPAGCAGTLYLYSDSPFPDADVAVDPEPGRKTRVTLPLAASTAAEMRRGGRVKVALYTNATYITPVARTRRVRLVNR